MSDRSPPLRPNTRLRQWERATTPPLLSAAAVFLTGYALPILVLDLPGALVWFCHLLVWVTWALFSVDAVVRLVLNRQRRRYLAFHLFDLAMIVLSLFRPFTLLRLATMIRFLNRKASRGLRGRLVIYVAAGCALLLFCGSLAILDAERAGRSANIHTFGDALWWAIETMTTVGYGDHYPTTDTGRLVAVAVMVGGITLLGLVTATLASWLVQRVGAEERDQAAELRGEIRELSRRVEHLTAIIERNHRPDRSPDRQAEQTAPAAADARPRAGLAVPVRRELENTR